MASDGGIYTCQATLTVVDDVFTFDDYSQVTLTGECASFLFYGTLMLLLSLWAIHLYLNLFSTKFGFFPHYCYRRI